MSIKAILRSASAEADEIFEDVYSSQKIQHAHIEPHAALAYWEPSGKLVIYTSTQNPSLVRAQLAELFDLPQSKVRLIVPYVGGGYGAKTHPRLEPLTATLARKAHRPVQWVLSARRGFSHGSLPGRDRADQNRGKKRWPDHRPSSRSGVRHRRLCSHFYQYRTQRRAKYRVGRIG